MRVVFVRQNFSSFGGGELILDRLMNALVDKGVDVTIIARSWPRSAGSFEFVRCNPRRVSRSLRDRRFAAAASRLVASLSGSIVEAHERIACCDIFRAGDGVHAAYLAWRRHGMSKLAEKAMMLSPYHRSVLGLEKRLFSSARLKAVLVNSHMVADEVVRYYGYSRDRIHFVPNGIDLERFSPDAREVHRDSTRRKFGVAPDRPLALFIGSGYARKGLAKAIEALSLSRADAELWVVGSDRKPATYIAIAERLGVRLRMFGPQAYPVPFYAAADLLLLPSIYDPFPSTVVEALACGLPVVTSTSCGAREAVVGLDPGLVRSAFDAEGLGAAIDQAIELTASSSTAPAARAIAKEYGMDRMVEKHISIYEHLALVAEAPC